MVFEDHPNDNIHTPFKNAHSTNKRSISNNRDIEVEELMNVDDSDEHWLWGSMKRIRRSIDKLLGTENPSEVSQSTERQPKHAKKLMSKHRKKVLVGEKRKMKKNFKNVVNSKSIDQSKQIGGKTMRPKRQDYDDGFDDDEDEEEDDENLEPISSGSSSLPEVEVSEKEDRLCKYITFCFIFYVNIP